MQQRHLRSIGLPFSLSDEPSQGSVGKEARFGGKGVRSGGREGTLKGADGTSFGSS